MYFCKGIALSVAGLHCEICMYHHFVQHTPPICMKETSHLHSILLSMYRRQAHWSTPNDSCGGFLQTNLKFSQEEELILNDPGSSCGLPFWSCWLPALDTPLFRHLDVCAGSLLLGSFGEVLDELTGGSRNQGDAHKKQGTVEKGQVKEDQGLL